MIYNRVVDKTITEILYRDSQSYNELFKNVKKTLGKLSRDSYNFHIQKLKEDNIIRKRETYEGKIKKSYHYLTDLGVQKYRLQILAHKTEKEKNEYILEDENERRILSLLFLICDYRQDVGQSPHNIFTYNLSKEQLDVELRKCGSSLNDLVEYKQYPPVKYRGHKSEEVTQYRTKSDVRAFKVDRYFKDNLESTRYNLNLPGFSLYEFRTALKSRRIANRNITDEEIEWSLNSLIKRKNL